MLEVGVSSPIIVGCEGANDDKVLIRICSSCGEEWISKSSLLPADTDDRFVIYLLRRVSVLIIIKKNSLQYTNTIYYLSFFFVCGL